MDIEHNYFINLMVFILVLELMVTQG